MKTGPVKIDPGPAFSSASTPPIAGRIEPVANRSRNWLLIGLLGAYVNAVAYGFAYGQGNHEFDLPLVNWLRNPSLYPHDPITGAFARFPTIFWLVVASLSRWWSTKIVLFDFFVLTKLLFFVALARLVAARVKDNRLVACIVVSVALSEFLNEFTPLGASDILNPIQTHMSLAIAVMLWVGVFLLEGRWLLAGLLCAATIYLDALAFAYTLFALAAFAFADWPARRAQIVAAGLLGAVLSLPWLWWAPGVLYRAYPKGYSEALLAFYPFHLTLRSHSAYELLTVAGTVVAAACMVIVVRKAGVRTEGRLELLAASFLVPVLLGAFCGEFALTPTLARLQLLRADSFLLLYSLVLVQISGVRLLSSSIGGAAGRFLIGALAFLLPLSDSLGLLWPLFAALLLWTLNPALSEGFFERTAARPLIRWLAVILSLAAIILAGKADAAWTPTAVIFLVVFAGCFFVYRGKLSPLPIHLSRLAAAVSLVAFLMIAAGTLPKLSNLWHPVVSPTSAESDWRQVQQWAKANTPQDAQFLVPTYPGGFRAFSERSSWGEWKDGTAMFHDPAFAGAYWQRMQALGYAESGLWDKRAGRQANFRRWQEHYRNLPWQRLAAIARENHLAYIIQFRDVSYPLQPIFANHHYAVYNVPP